MGVIGHWRRSALGAGGVALLLPLGLALGLALTTALGGRDGLHALAQVFSGPSSPGRGAPDEQPGLEAARAVPSIPLPPRPRRIAVSAPATPQRSSAVTPTRAPVHTMPVRRPSSGT